MKTNVLRLKWLSYVSIVFMHIVCNTLRVILGVLVVALVGKFNITIREVENHILLSCIDVQVECIKHQDSYIPPLWIMCLESVAHLLVMLNFSSNFLIYCSVSNQFKSALSKVCSICSIGSANSAIVDASEYYSLHTTNLGIALQ